MATSRNAIANPLVTEGVVYGTTRGHARSARIAVRISREDQHRVEEATKARGYATPSAFVRAAIRNELNGRAELSGTEERIAGGFERVSKDIFRVGRGQQPLFALVDSLARAVLTCVPEPPPDARSQAIARARERYDGSSRLLVTPCQAMRALPCRIWWAMARTDEERKIRLRPPKPRVAGNEVAAWSNGFKLLMHYACSSRKTGNRGSSGKGKRANPYYQRCAVRVTTRGLNPVNGNRWIGWPAPRTSMNSPKGEPTKPSKPGFVGFVGALYAEYANIRPLLGGPRGSSLGGPYLFYQDHATNVVVGTEDGRAGLAQWPSAG